MKTLKQHLNEAFIMPINNPYAGAIYLLLGCYAGIKYLVKKIRLKKENSAAQHLMDEIVENQLKLVEILKQYPDITKHLNTKYKSVLRKQIDVTKVGKSISDSTYYDNYRKTLTDDISNMAESDKTKFIEIFDKIFELQKELYISYGHLRAVRLLWLHGDTITIE